MSGHVLAGYFGPLGSWFYCRLEQALGALSDCLIGVSAAAVDDLVRLGVAPRSKFRVVPIGLDLSRFLNCGPADGAALQAEAGVTDGEVLVTFVGRLVPIKRVDRALHALASARGLGARVRLAIVGNGDLRSGLEQLAGELGLGGFVRFLGYLEDMVTVASAADVALLTSDNEGTPVSLIEAGAAGNPAVATSVGGVREVVTAESGIVADPDDAEALARAITTLAHDPAARTRMGEQGRRHVSERYSVERLVNDVDLLYQELLAATRA